MDTWSCHLNRILGTGGEGTLGTEPESSCRPVGLETSADVTEALGYREEFGLENLSGNFPLGEN